MAFFLASIRQRARVCANAVVSRAQNFQLQLYSTNPLDRKSTEVLHKSVVGRLTGKHRKPKKVNKNLRLKNIISLGLGHNVEWPGLTHPLNRTRYNPKWLTAEDLSMKKTGLPKPETSENEFYVRDLEGDTRVARRPSELYWDRRGWSGRLWGGRYVGCPEAPDGTPLTGFRSCVTEMKRVSNQTKGGKRRSVSALVVVGNGNGVAGYAIGKGDNVKSAIRKAKNKAVNRLQFFPICDNHTIYHNVKVKSCRTTIYMEKKIEGFGLRCQRAIKAVCELVGLKDMRAKLIGSNNPHNILRATFKGLTSQETYQDLADRTGKILVEYRRECYDRPIVIARPSASSVDETASSMARKQEACA